jgi:hypothetical protein
MTVALNQAVTDFYAGAHALTVSDPSLPVTSPAVAYVVGPGPATNLSFTAQPIDTQKGSPIYSACLPDPSLSCATSSPTVTVLAKDTWLNLASTTVTIGISPSGTGLGSKATVNGVADFGQQLSINTTGFYRLRASADGTTADSNSIQIVDQLKACTGNACKNVVNNGQKNVQLAVNTIAPITGQTFTGTSVLLATSFFDTAQYAGKCGAAPFIGQGTQAIVEGAGTSTVQPTTTMLLIMPKRSLQAFGVASRNAASFNICLGATRLDGQTGSWQSKNADGTLGLATPDPSPATATSTYWGNVADCGTPNLTSSDPCAAVKSKNVADVVAYFNGIGDTATANSIPSLMQNSDLAIVIHKAFPFDGKGMYQ